MVGIGIRLVRELKVDKLVSVGQHFEKGQRIIISGSAEGIYDGRYIATDKSVLEKASLFRIIRHFISKVSNKLT